MTTQIPKWRKPVEKSEGDSLVLDIILFLESFEEDSAERELALQKAFTIATYAPDGVTREQYTDIMSILWAYGDEAINPVLLAVADCSIAEVISVAKSFIHMYDEYREMSREDTLSEIKIRYQHLVKKTREEINGVGRSVLAWQNHKLYYFHPGGLMYEVEIKDRYTTTVHSGVVETIVHLTDEEKKALTIKRPLSSYKPTKKQIPWYDNDVILWLIFVFMVFSMCGVIVYFIK